MILSLFLQLGFWIDSVPLWLAPLLVLLGVELILIYHIQQSVYVVPRDNTDLQHTDKISIPTRDYKLLISGLTFGILLSAIAVIQNYQISNWYIILLLFCGRAIEGVAAIRFYKKMVRFTRSRRWGGDFGAKIKHKLTAIFIIFIGLYFIGYAIVNGPFLRSLGYTIQFIWTIVTLFVTFIGLHWKLRPVRDKFDQKIIFGVILFTTGAELFNFAFIGQLIATLAGAFGYTIGFWFAAAILIRDQQEPVVMGLKHRIRDIRIWLRS